MKPRNLLCFPLVFAAIGAAGAEGLAKWTFDALQDGTRKVLESVGNQADELQGNAWLVPGVSGQALQFDGITAHIRRPARQAPRLSGSFTVEAWIAIGAYPFNWCPVLQQQDKEQAGFFLGIGDKGQVTFRLASGGRWTAMEGIERIPLRQWAHIAAVYEAGRAASLYVNGRLAASQSVTGDFQPAGSDLWIGRNAYELEQTAPVSTNRQHPARILFDGILDEVAISAGAKTEPQIAEEFDQHQPGAPPLERRVLPAGPPGPGSFGAAYARLKYYRGWDDMWRVGEYPDIVVRFDEAPYRYVFWRGMSYIPNWVTENGIWYNNEFTESFQKGLQGSAEPMSDKLCLFSHARIIESSDARVVIHWRYAPVDVSYKFAWVDPLTGWGDWTDEIHTIYPDGIAARKITAHTTDPSQHREWHEGIIVMSPGMSPNEAIEPRGLTLINNAGETQTYSWDKETPPKFPKQPPEACMQLINTKSKYKPFAAARPADKPYFDIYAGEIRKEISIYPWWNHWPTAFEPSNGRYAQAADRASHSSLTHLRWGDYQAGDKWITKIMLHGITERPVSELAHILHSWSAPPKLQITSQCCEGGEYDHSERAYSITLRPGQPASALAFVLKASEESPVRNVALVVRGWNRPVESLVVNGKSIPRGRDFRFGYRDLLDSRDLIVWFRLESKSPVPVALVPRR